MGVLEGSQTFPTATDMIAEMTAIESSIAVLPVYQAFNNVLPMANLPVTLEDGSELVITADDVQLYKVGAGATAITTDEATGSIFASPATGGVPVEGNFDLASSKIVLGEGAPLVGLARPRLRASPGVRRPGEPARPVLRAVRGAPGRPGRARDLRRDSAA